ncbi:MAG: mechanosensitive ion channel protein MscS [Deltaproteobacteria bacterium CG11_big_fil_rev_8_21_14_0_20_45_16]|nr:MAG: mechanosensitive ion channel protein MscS [Deltaproteobacteria bacterium CG11_big_fil_rev_8_21_14_0_20_45_16]
MSYLEYINEFGRKYNLELFNNSLLSWMFSLVTAFLIFSGILILKRVIERRLEHLSKKTETGLDDLVLELIQKIRKFFVVTIAVYVAATFLKFSPKFEHGMKSVFVVLLLLQVWFWGIEVIDFLIYRLVGRDKKLARSDSAIEGTMPALQFLGRLILVSVVVLLALENLGFDVTTLVASLGVGGIAVALAVQNILGDLFASLSIVLDKPFAVEDTIKVNDFVGTVEKIGLKSTRVRSLSGEQLIFSNSDLLSSRIQNFRRLQERRVLFSIGVTYQTSIEKLKQIPNIMKRIIDDCPDSKFDRCHFLSFGASSLDFETVFYVLSADYLVYMNAQEYINLALFEAFEKEGIDFAYPTQTLYIEKNELGVGLGKMISEFRKA